MIKLYDAPESLQAVPASSSTSLVPPQRGSLGANSVDNGDAL